MPKYKACTLQQYKAITKEMNFLDFETERILNAFQFFFLSGLKQRKADELLMINDRERGRKVCNFSGDFNWRCISGIIHIFGKTCQKT